MKCEDCGRPTNGQWVDFGVGPGEFWGRPFCDVNWQWVSECCEGDILDENGNLIDPPEEGEDEDG
jgi:hypothetical protein